MSTSLGDLSTFTILSKRPLRSLDRLILSKAKVVYDSIDTRACTRVQETCSRAPSPVPWVFIVRLVDPLSRLSPEREAAETLHRERGCSVIVPSASKGIVIH
jgi:hypothetical protein